MIQFALASTAVAVTSRVALPANAVSYQPPPAWVVPIPIPTEARSSKKPLAAAEVLLANEQIHLTATSDETFVETALKINSAAGLASGGSLAAAWNPLTDVLTIHRARIIRDEKVIDLLSGGKTFTVLRRESNLEASVIDGALTATLQPEGLQVGDVLDFAMTLSRHDPALGDHSEASLTLAHSGIIKRMYVKASWPDDRPIRLWRSDDIAPTTPQEQNGWRVITYDQSDTVSVDPPEGASFHARLRGVVQFTDFKDWSDLSKKAYSLFASAEVVKEASPLTTQIAKLKAESSDPRVRTLSALQLVEDKIRYLYVALDAGGYVPASADQTWERRFGDCKGKTVLLLALLHGLGVDAEAVLVSTQTGDGLDQRLPQIAAFDHVLVRATIAHHPYWLDATRLGDENLDLLKKPNMFWALPLRAFGANLEPLIPEPLAIPELDKDLSVDLRAGVDHPAKAHMDITLRGDGALAFNLVMKQASTADADRALRKVFESDLSWIKPDKVGFSYDAKAGVGRLAMDGSGLAPFTTGAGGKEWWIELSSVGWNADFRRNTNYHVDAPYAVTYPDFQRSVVRVQLPDKAFTVGNSGPLVETVAGRAYTRSASLDGDQFLMTATASAVAAEFPASEASAAQAKLRELSLHDVVLQRAASPSAAEPHRADESVALSDEALSPRQKARVAFIKKDYERAEAEFSDAIKSEPNSAELLYNRGAVRLLLNRDQVAKTDFEAALKLAPKDAFVLFALGRLSLAHGDLADADQHFKDAVAAASNSHAMAMRVAWAYDQTNHLDEAAIAYENWAAEEKDTTAQARGFNQGCWARGRTGAKLSEAAADCDRALALKNDYAPALDSRGLVELRTSAFSAAFSDYDQALRLRPDIATSLYGRGVAEIRLGRHLDGEKDLAAAKAVDPKIDAKFKDWGIHP